MMTKLVTDFDMMQYFAKQILQTKISSDAFIKWELKARHETFFSFKKRLFTVFKATEADYVME